MNPDIVGEAGTSKELRTPVQIKSGLKRKINDESPAILKVKTPKRTYARKFIMKSPTTVGLFEFGLHRRTSSSGSFVVKSPATILKVPPNSIKERPKAARRLGTSSNPSNEIDSLISDGKLMDGSLLEGCQPLESPSTSFSCSTERNSKRSSIKGHLMSSKKSNAVVKQKMIQRSVIWPANITFMFLHTLNKMNEFRHKIKHIEEDIEELRSARESCVCNLETDENGIQRRSSTSSMFTQDPGFPNVTIRWLQSRAGLATRAFISELMKILFDISEIKGRSATGNLAPLSKYNKNKPVVKKAIDAARRNFIYEKVREKYSKATNDVLENELRFVNMHISSVCNQYSKIKNDNTFKKTRYGDPNMVGIL